MATDLLFDRALTDAELTEVLAAVTGRADPCTNAGLTAAVAYYTIAARGLGYASIGDLARLQPAGTVNVQAFRLPDPQWSTVFEAILTAENESPLTLVAWGLDWLDKGPSRGEVA